MWHGRNEVRICEEEWHLQKLTGPSVPNHRNCYVLFNSVIMTMVIDYKVAIPILQTKFVSTRPHSVLVPVEVSLPDMVAHNVLHKLQLFPPVIARHKVCHGF